MPRLLRDWRDGRIKLAVVASLLRHRAEQSALYADGDYQPLPASGPRSEEIGAYARVLRDQRLIVAVALYSRRRELDGFEEQTQLPIPETFADTPWREILSGRTVSAAAGRLDPRGLFSHLPVAVLVSP
jgi:(1->4)-alpha-D-glucan 1-alpha-D-glucosylmutase